MCRLKDNKCDSKLLFVYFWSLIHLSNCKTIKIFTFAFLTFPLVEKCFVFFFVFSFTFFHRMNDTRIRFDLRASQTNIYNSLQHSQICTKFENVTRLVLRQRIASLYKIEKKKKNRRTTLIEDGTREMARKNELPRINRGCYANSPLPKLKVITVI